MSAMTAKRISQETFDEVVKENVEDFEMEPSEALAEVGSLILYLLNISLGTSLFF